MKSLSLDVLGFVTPSERQRGAVTMTKTPMKHVTATLSSFERKNRSERIKIPAVGHVKDGWMELHIVAEGGEQIDVEHIESIHLSQAAES